MKKFLLFMSVGVTSLVLSAVAVGQMKKAMAPYGQPPKVTANGEMLSAKAVKSADVAVLERQKRNADGGLTGLQKIQLEKFSKKRVGVKTGKPVYHAPVMKIREIGPAAVADGNARITLDVQMDWGDNTGYQLLLDADHDTYGTAFLYPSTSGMAMRIDTESYGEFEYKLPSDAKPDGSGDAGGCVMFGERESLEFPAGTYDFVVGNPDPAGGQVYVAGGDGACGDDYQFNAGTEYLITVTLSADESGDNCTLSVVAPVDLAVVEITSPSTSMGLGASENVTVRVRNNGTDELQSYRLALTVDGSAVATETVNEALASGAENEYTFAAKANLSNGGKHTIKVEASVDGDADATNNAVEKSVINLQALMPPVRFDFSVPENMDYWTVVDANKDGKTWAYSESDGGVVAPYSATLASDDYLVTLAPVVIPAGDAHFSLTYAGRSAYFAENLRVLYGKTSDLSEMEVMGQINGFMTETPETKTFNFTADEEGEYYFAVHACSEAGMFGIILYDVAIDEGRYVAVPDLSVDRVVVPMSSTQLSNAETISVEVSNNSEAAIESYSLSYTVNGGASVSQSFGALAVGESAVVEFDQKADFSAEGSYEVVVVASNIVSDLAEENTENNTASATAIHYAPADVPFSVDFSDPDQRGDWTYEGDAWSYDEYYGGMLCNADVELPLISRGINLEAGKAYRFRFEYMAGTSFLGMFMMPDDFNVIYGKDGTPIDEWTVLEEFEQIYTEEAFVFDNVDFTCEESGVYSIAIVPVYTNGTFTVASASLSEKLAYDVRLASVTAPVMIPAEQAGKFVVTANVVNEGSNVISSTVVVKNGDAEVGRATAQDIAVGAEVAVPVEVVLSGAASGSVVNLEVSAAADGHESDDTSDDNSASKQIAVTEEVLGYDNVTDGMYIEDYCIGSQSGAIGCGVPFSLASEDVLTGISIGWGAVAEQSIQIAVYEYDPATRALGNAIFSEVVPQGSEVGQVVYEISPRLLGAGDYMASVVYTGFCLVTDMEADGALYITSANPAVVQTGLGTPAIRTVFGEGEPVAKDVVVEEIVSPSARGLFSANEPVVVSVKNDGSEEIAGTLALSINGAAAGSQPIALGGYASSEIAFEADLSKPGEYVLEVVATVEGDENADNNSASKTVVSVEPADPYTMDFEQCEDFASSGFNPAWRVVDGDGNYIYGFQDVAFPIPADGKAAYIVFNPAMTTPSMSEQPAIAPHGGERFAACFAASDDPSGVAQNNDWLISPKLTLPTADAQMTFFVKSYIGEYGLEKYNVLVSETDDNLESFEMIGTTREAPYDAWEEVTVDLSEYAGKEVYLAIQCVSEDAFIFMLDDIIVSKPVSSVAENAVAMLSLYPNPATEMIVISSGGSAIEKVEIFNASGSAVYSSRVADSNSFRYNVSALDAGVYFAKVATSDGTKVMRFIVK